MAALIHNGAKQRPQQVNRCRELLSPMEALEQTHMEKGVLRTMKLYAVDAGATQVCELLTVEADEDGGKVHWLRGTSRRTC